MAARRFVTLQRTGGILLARFDRGRALETMFVLSDMVGGLDAERAEADGQNGQDQPLKETDHGSPTDYTKCLKRRVSVRGFLRTPISAE